MGITMTL